MTTYSDMSDSALISLVRKADEGAFSALANRHAARAHAVALAIAAVRSDADDIVQDAFIRALERLHTLRDPDRFAPWMISIVRNTAREYNRKNVRRRKLADRLPEEQEAAIATPERREAMDLIRREVAQLKPIYRDAITLHYFAGLPTDEVAHTLGISADAAYKRLQRARNELGEALLVPVEPAQGVSNEAVPRLTKSLAGTVMAAGGIQALMSRGALAMGGGGGLLTLAAGWKLALVVALMLAAAGVVYVYGSIRDASEPAVAARDKAPETANEFAEQTSVEHSTAANEEAIPVVTGTDSVADTPKATADDEEEDYSYAGHVVRSDGERLAEATVEFRVFVRSGPDKPGRVDEAVLTTDDSGQFKIKGIHGDEAMFTTYRDWETRAGRTDVQAVAGDQNIELVVRGPAIVRGRVMSSNTGGPIANAELGPFFGTLGYRGRGARVSYWAIAENDGTFEVSIDSSKVHLYSKSPGYAPDYVTVENLEPDEIRDDVTITLVPSRIVSGVVTTHDGTLIEGASVYIGHGEIKQLQAREPDAYTGPDGQFYLDSVPEHVVRVSAYAEGYAPASKAFPEGGGDVEIEITQGASVGVFVYRKNRPVAEQPVSLRVSDFRILKEATDENGFCLFEEVPIGQAHTILSYIRKNLEIHEATYYERVINLDKFNASVSGRVTRLGQPWPGTTVSVRLYSDEYHSYWHRTRTDAEGRYFFDSLPAGFVAVMSFQSYSDGMGYATYTLKPGENATVDLSYGKGATIRGKVTNLQHGYRNTMLLFWSDAPLLDPDGSLFAFSNNETRVIYNLEIGEDGAYEFTRIAAGDYILTAWSLPEQSTEGINKSLLHRQVLRVNDGDVIDLDFELKPTSEQLQNR